MRVSMQTARDLALGRGLSPRRPARLSGGGELEHLVAFLDIDGDRMPETHSEPPGSTRTLAEVVLGG